LNRTAALRAAKLASRRLAIHARPQGGPTPYDGFPFGQPAGQNHGRSTDEPWTPSNHHRSKSSPFFSRDARKKWSLNLITHPSHRAGDVRPSLFAVAASAISDRVATGCNALRCKARRAFMIAKRIACFPLCGRDSHAVAVATAGVFLPLNANRDSRVFVEIATKKEMHDAE